MFESPAYAQAAGQAAANGPPFWFSMLPIIAMFAIIYLLMIRPQQRRMKEHQTRIGAVKKGDTVITGGGLVGKVMKVDDQHVEVELAPQVRVRAVKSTLTDVTPVGGSKPAND